MKSKFTIVNFPVFEYKICVEFTSDFKKSMLANDQTKEFANEDHDVTNAWTIRGKDGSDISFIFLKLDARASTLAHEAWHAIQHMLEYHGVKLDGEVVAYHLTYLIEKMIDLQRKRNALKGRTYYE